MRAAVTVLCFGDRYVDSGYIMGNFGCTRFIVAQVKTLRLIQPLRIWL